MQKSYIWSLPTRVFHLTFALLITICLLTEDDLLMTHVISGYLLLVPFTFRIIWGFIGPKYSLFKDFHLSIKKSIYFIFNIFEKEQRYIGHNPLASIVMFSMILLVPFVIFTGALVLGSEEGKGFFYYLYENELFEELHEITANIMYLLIFAHLAGITVDRLLHKEHGNLSSIFNGYKNTKENESIELNIFQKLIFTIFFLLFFIFLIYLIFDSTNPFIN